MEVENALNNPTFRKFILEIAGEEGVEVIKAMENGGMTDEEITENVEFDLNTTRKALYDLYEARLAEYDRSRNEETGWITYTWRLNLENLEDAVESHKKEILEKLKERLKFEKNNMFYCCPSKHKKYLFDEAMDLGFRCPECGESMDPIDNSEFIKNLEAKINEIENELNGVE